MTRPVCFGKVLLLSLILSLTVNAKTTRLRDIYGAESLLSLKETQSLVESAEDAFYRAEYAVAFEAAQRALKITEERLGTTHKDVAIILCLLGEGHMLLGDYVEADKSLTRALQIGEAVLGKRHPVVGRTLMRLSGTRLALGNLTEVAPSSERALQILANHYGTNSVAFAEGLQASAIVLMTAGKLREAEMLGIRSLETLKSQLGSDDFYVGECFWGLGSIRQQLARYDEAISNCEESRRILLQTVGTNHMSIALVNTTLAGCYQQIAKFDEARKLLTENLAILERTIGRQSLHAANALNSIGLLDFAKGDSIAAEQKFRLSLEAREKYLGTNSVGYAALLNNLALALRTNGRTERDIAQLYETSVRIIENSGGKDNPELATALVNWSAIVESSGDVDSAAKLLQRALTIRSNAFGEKHPAVARSWAGLASLVARAGLFVEALRFADLALNIDLACYGENHPDVADSFFVVGDVLSKMGCNALSAEIFGRAVAIQIRCFGSDPDPIIYPLLRMAEAQVASGQFDTALTNSFMASVGNIQSLLRRVTRSDEKAHLYFSTAARVEASELHSLCQICSTSDLAVKSAAFGAVEAAFAKGIIEEVQTTQASLEADSSTVTRHLLVRHDQLLSQLRDLANTHLDLVERDRRRQELESDLRQIEVSLSSRVTAVEKHIRDREFGFLQIPHSLPTNAVLLDFVGYLHFDFQSLTNRWREGRYAVYLTFPLAKDSTAFVVERVELGEAAPINETIEQITKLMAAGQIAPKRLQPVLQRLSDLVYAPLGKHLTNVSHLIVCPDGQLSRVPFEMLLHEGKYLIETKTVSYVTSGREVVRLASGQSGPKSKESKVQSSKSLVMGDPDFDLDLAGSSRREEALTSKSEIGQSLLTSAATKYLSRSARGLKFDRLPSAAEEARSIAKLLGDESALRLGKEAREAELKAVVSPRVLHLATHGFFLSDQEFKHTNAPLNLQTAVAMSAGAAWGRISGTRWNASLPREDWENPLVRCGIALAGANRALQITNAVAEDGLLTGLEASLLNLQGTELVILSACDTGAGDIKIGEGVMSLRRAFRIAGAETVLASHWKVSDRATSQLMTEFMRRWRSGRARGQAWREAQLALLHSKEFSNPYFWAAFTLTGQWR